jgi:phenylalanyl-tRNA synthetase beta chain
VTFSFLPRAQAELFGGGSEALTLANPISADLDVMRPSILPNLAMAMARNASRGLGDLGLFEVGPHYADASPEGQALVAAGLRAGRTGPRHWRDKPRAVDAFDAKADAMALLTALGAPVENFQVTADAPAWYHPGQSGQFRLGPTVLARFGTLHPRVAKALDLEGPAVAFEVMLDRIPQPKSKPGPQRPPLKASAYQPVERDFAFLLASDVPADKLIRAARSADKTLIQNVSLFDLYEGDRIEAGKKSVAISVTLQPSDRTLTDAEIEQVSQKIVAAVMKATGAVLRS